MTAMCTGCRRRPVYLNALCGSCFRAATEAAHPPLPYTPARTFEPIWVRKARAGELPAKVLA